MARNVKVNLLLEAAKYIRGARDAEKATEDLADGLDDAARASDKTTESTEKLGGGLDHLARDAHRLDKQIAESKKGIRDLAREIATTADEAKRADLTKKLGLEQRGQRKLIKLRDLIDLDDNGGEEAARGFAARFGARLGPLMASMPIGPGGAVAGATLAAAMAPTLGAGLAAAVVGGAAGGGIIGGALIAARDERVKAAGADLGEFMLGDLEKRASAFVPVAITSIGKVRAAWISMGPDLDRIFSSSRFVDPLVDGAISGGKRLVSGIGDAVVKAAPVMEAFGRSFDAIGGAAGNFFTTLSGDAKEGASAIDDLTASMVNLMDTTTLLVHYAAALKGGADKFDVWIDRQRYAIEDSDVFQGVLGGLLGGIDLTADGFKRGSKEAEAYRAATLGTATTADFATLKLAGMTDAEIAGADASGTYRNKIGEVNTAAGITTTRFYDSNAAMVIFNASMQEGIEKTGSLTAAFLAVNGAALTSREAESNYQAAIDNVSASIKANGTTLDLHTEKGRANDKAIRNLIGTVNANAQAAYDAKAATGDLAGAEADAKKVYESGRQQLIKNLTQILGNRDAAIALAGKIMAIPKSWSTEVSAPGAKTATKQVQDFNFAVKSVPPSKTVPFRATVAEAKAAVEALRLKIAQIKSKHVYVTGSVRWTSSGDLKVPGGTILKNDRGGVYEHAAVGKLRDAQIASPMGPARYAWAEPSTGGEAFIPRRGMPERSIPILQRAAQWYGHQVVPAGGGSAAAVVDARQVAAMVASAVAAEIRHVTVQMDGRTVGYIQGRQANILSR